MSGGIPLVVANPSDDAEFRDAIEGCVAGGVRGPDELQEYLRQRFPRAVVRRRDLSGEAQATWYAYRGGHWVAATPRPSRREGK
jgi:hypothetical protein